MGGEPCSATLDSNTAVQVASGGQGRHRLLPSNTVCLVILTNAVQCNVAPLLPEKRRGPWFWKDWRLTHQINTHTPQNDHWPLAQAHTCPSPTTSNCFFGIGILTSSDCRPKRARGTGRGTADEAPRLAVMENGQCTSPALEPNKKVKVMANTAGTVHLLVSHVVSLVVFAFVG